MKDLGKVLITGARGMLGQTLRRLAAESGTWELLAWDLTELDITNREKTLRTITDEKPDCLINCAAYTNVDGAESNRNLAFSVNRDGAANLALACEKAGTRFLHISTDYVFGGKTQKPCVEDDPVNAKGVYAESKEAGEREILKVNTKAMIVRTSWLFGPGGPNFVRTICLKAKQDPKTVLKIVTDQRGRPTYTFDLAQTLLALARRNESGFLHFANTGECSWYEYAKSFLPLAGLNPAIVPVTTEEFPRPAPRPAYSVLSTKKYEGLFGREPRPWVDCVRDYLRDDLMKELASL